MFYIVHYIQCIGIFPMFYSVPYIQSRYRYTTCFTVSPKTKLQVPYYVLQCPLQPNYRYPTTMFYVSPTYTSYGEGIYLYFMLDIFPRKGHLLYVRTWCIYFYCVPTIWKVLNMLAWTERWNSPNQKRCLSSSRAFYLANFISVPTVDIGTYLSKYEDSLCMELRCVLYICTE